MSATHPPSVSLVARADHAVLLFDGRDLVTVPVREALARIGDARPLVCHRPAVAARLGADGLAAFDLLELFAFVHAGQVCQPTPHGLAAALGLPRPADDAGLVHAQVDCVDRLLDDLGRRARGPDAATLVGLAWTMGKGGWPWAPLVLDALGRPGGPTSAEAHTAGRVWTGLPQWSAEAPPPPPRHEPVSADEAQVRLAAMLGADAEPRRQQAGYAAALVPAFAPRPAPEDPNVVLAEAGTGVGKTLGYLAPASLWAERNHAPVWVSTYTRNLQHQIDRELKRLPRTSRDDAQRVVIRKGRENYLCLLNLEEATRVLPVEPRHAAAWGLMARWVTATRDGDLTGADFPGWLVDILGAGRTLGLADRRGECIHSACSHYNRCFIERSTRRARRADLVVANHALALIQAALGGLDEGRLPTRYVFDEGHHLFDAADSVFSAHLTGREMAELRRWLIGGDGQRRSRLRGLRRRCEDLIADDPGAQAALDAIEMAARRLPGEGWLARVLASDAEDGRGTAAERFLALVRHQVLARAQGVHGPYDIETEPSHPVDGLPAAADALDRSLADLQRPLQALGERLRAQLVDDSETLETATRQRLDALVRALDRRARAELGAWRQMLLDLSSPSDDDVVDWFALSRAVVGGRARDVDVGYHRHWIDPMKPFADVMAAHAHGLVVTSATLTDGTGDTEADWQAAETRSGARHLPRRPPRVGVASPFDYPAQTRVLVVRDVRKDDLDQVAAAYAALFRAADGGALGLFTAIERLRAVHRRIAGDLESAGIPLFAQHVDGMGVATLIDIFRGEERSCLLGTDAVRDGVDVPGRSLRLIVFDRVPWPRPTIVHRARRAAFQGGGRGYDDMLVRLRLKQAYGRLIRRASDAGVFVLLDPMMPSRLAGAFPDGVEVQRTGLADAVAVTRAFLDPAGPS